MNSDNTFVSCPLSGAATNPPPVPKLLVSVRNSQEVLAALAGGADWIDLKEPSAGPLAAVSLQVAKEAVKALAGRRTMSAALGELRDWKTSLAEELLAVVGVSFVKLGLSGCAGQSDWQQQWQAVAAAARKANKQLVAVIYADWQKAAAPAPAAVISIAQAAESQFLLIDTYDKSTGSTFDHLSNSRLGEVLQQAKQAALTTVLAGSITTELINQIPCEGVDMVAVRGAVCRGGRTDRVEAGRVENFRKALAARSTESQRHLAR